MSIGKRPKGLIVAFIVGIIAAIIAAGVFDLSKMQGTAMEPEIKSNSRILINKLTYLYSKPKSGDVVTFHCNVYSEDQEGSTLVRRVVATEGDRVEIRDGNLYINDVLYEGYQEQNIYMEPMDELVVGKNRVFVLSDSQSAVLDSRNQAVGQLRTDELTGKVCFE